MPLKKIEPSVGLPSNTITVNIIDAAAQHPVMTSLQHFAFFKIFSGKSRHSDGCGVAGTEHKSN